MTWNDHAKFLTAAKNAGWEVQAEKGAFVINRGDELIDIEISNGGIPKTVRRTHADGSHEVISQNYIRMIDVLGWIQEESKGEPAQEES